MLPVVVVSRMARLRGAPVFQQWLIANVIQMNNIQVLNWPPGPQTEHVWDPQSRRFSENHSDIVDVCDVDLDRDQEWNAISVQDMMIIRNINLRCTAVQE